MPGKIPSMMTFTRLSNAAVTMDTLVSIDTNGKVGPATPGDNFLGVALNGTSAADAEVSIDPGVCIANLTALLAVTAGDRLVAAAAGTVKKFDSASKTVTVANATDIWSSTAHGYASGEAVRLSNSGGALPAGTDNATTYYVGRIDADTFYLYDTEANALAGGATGRINASGDGTGTHSARLFGTQYIVGQAIESMTTAGAKVAVLVQKQTVVLT